MMKTKIESLHKSASNGLRNERNLVAFRFDYRKRHTRFKILLAVSEPISEEIYTP